MRNRFSIFFFGLFCKSTLLIIISFFLLGPFSYIDLLAQTTPANAISGKVYDVQGEPLIGVAVKEAGTSNGVITNADGVYSITATTKNPVLNFSYLGYEETDVEVGNKKWIDIILTEKVQKLDEVVVIGYGESTRKDLTGAISTVGADVISKSAAIDFSQALQGRVAGLQITSQSGEAGAGVDIKIRGANSINAGTYPLYVIDGMQIDINEGEVATSNVGSNATYNPLSTINPNDIESIDVLKDASATAIYGSRAANGVIIVTTKRGTASRGSYNIDLNAYIGVGTVARRIEMLSPQEFVDYQFSRNIYRETYGRDTDGDGIIDAPVDAGNYNQYNWQDLMLRNSITKNIDLSLNGTSKGGTSISSSLGYLNQEGLIISNDYSRQTGRLKLDHELNDKLKIGASVTFGQTISNGAISSGGGEGSYNGVVQSIYLERPIELYAPAEGGDEYQDGWFPLTSMITSETYKKQSLTRLYGNIYADYKINNNFTLKARASKNMSFSKMQEYYSSRSKWGRSDNGRASIQTNETSSYNASAQIEYYNRFKSKHSIRVMLGGELSSYHSERAYIKTTDFEDETTGVFDISKGKTPFTPTSNVYETARMSTFSRLLYNYMYRYYLTLSFRADASSYFQPGNRTGYFPSAAFSWRINEERFFKNVDFINNFKLRLSVGANGNDRIPVYSSFATLGANYYSENGSKLLGISPLNHGNPDLKWETTYQYNGGVDLDFFNSRISLVVDVYYKDTKDMLLNAKIPSQGGFMYQWQNIGRVENKGLEIGLITRNIEKRHFSWTTNFNIDFNRNKVLSLGESEYLPVSIPNTYFSTDQGRVIVGEAIGTGFGYQFDGVYQIEDFKWTDKKTGEVVDPSIINSGNMGNYSYTLLDDVVSINSMAVRPGYRKYKDLSGPDGESDGTITADDRTVISNSNPLFNFGFGNTLTYKNFELSFFFTGSYGFQIINEFKRLTEGGNPSQFNLTKEYWNNHWTPENPSNTYSNVENDNSILSSYYVEDGSYIRLQNIALNYNFNKGWVKKIKLQNIAVYGSVNNVFLLTKYSGLDPEVKSPNNLLSGYDRLSYPRARTYTFGLKITL